MYLNTKSTTKQIQQTNKPQKKQKTKNNNNPTKSHLILQKKNVAIIPGSYNEVCGNAFNHS